MRNVLLIIFFYFLIHKSFAIIHLENITVTHGENVKFRCQFPLNYSLKENILQWKKSRLNDDNLIISINGKIPKTFENSYRTDLTNHSTSLELFHVEKDDSTSYICQTFETQTILCQFNLVVLIKPEASLLTMNKENIEEYQAVTLTCSSLNGNPPPQYTWYRNNTLLTSLTDQVITTGNSSIYTFNVTRLDNQVKYECEILNQALTIPIRIEQYLHVKYRPYVKILEETTVFSSEQDQIRKIIGYEYQQQNFTCLFDANPPPISIYWITNETTIVSREKMIFIPRLTSEQSGIYTCIVENAIGKVNRSIYLDVQYAPRVRIIESRIIVNRSDSTVLRCTFDANPIVHEIKWFKNNTEIIQGHQSTDLHIDRVERNDSGLYTCIGYNRFYNNQINNGSNKIEVLVQTRPIIETTHSKLAAEIGQSITLTCHVIGQPKANISWKFDQQIIQCDELITDICYLRFSKLTRKDFGSYQCMAENLLGKEEWTYYIVARGKPETPTNILVSEITSSSFKIQFSPSFDGGSGSQQFLIQISDPSNSSIINQQIPLNNNQYTINNLNESTLYLFRIKSTNIYGESPWSNDIPVQTNELLITSEDLPQLHMVSYNSKEYFLEFDYLPDNSRLVKLNEEQLCLNLRQSSDGKFYRLIKKCLSIKNHRISWKIEKEFSYLKLSICSKKYPHICGQEIEMKEEIKNRYFTPMIIGIITMTNILILIIIFIIIIFICCRWRKRRIQSNTNNLDKSVRPIISSPRLQNPYLLYSNSHSHSSPYDYEYQQRKLSSSFSHPYDIVDRPRASPQSNSNPTSESSCITQNTQEIPSNYYGFPPIKSPSKHQSTSSSENSTPNRIKKLFYEVVV